MKKLLVVVIILLLICMSIPSTGRVMEQSSTLFSNDNTWYVGGSGPGNYTKIQDAIDNSSDGDTIFVFNDSSPYYENVAINKTINLSGEDKNTTIINGNDSGMRVYVSADRVNICGFRILNGYYGIYIDSDYNNISGNIITSAASGIYLNFSRGNTITDNIISINYGGIELEYSSYNIISSNNIIDNSMKAIYLHNTNNNTITGNTISNNHIGIRLYISNHITISENIISNNIWGIELFITKYNTIIDNSFFKDGLRIGIGSVYHNNVENNTVNNKPLVYLEDKSDAIIDVDSGQVCLVNCYNITVQNQIISDTNYGISLKGTKNCFISNNKLSSNYGYGISLIELSSDNIILNNNISSNRFDGIWLYKSYSNTINDNNIIFNSGDGINFIHASHNTIDRNTISYNQHGIRLELWDSDNNNIINNNIISNYRDGISLIEDSCFNIFKGNNISDNEHGIYLKSSSNNSIYHNNFIENKDNVYDEGNNIWDDGKKGNYWSDYEERYPDAKKKPLKGIWDTSYEIEGGNNEDNYPLINQYPKSVIKSKSIDKTFNYNFPLLTWLLDIFPLLQRLFGWLIL